ncbi:MAG: alpha/beta hydrolase [SAR324 cluster bacterium]|nr:alpha/beta hydrolase [SAR324 cluster bacterium]
MPSQQFQELYESLRVAPDRGGMSLEQLREAGEAKARRYPLPPDVAHQAVMANGAAAEWVSAPGAAADRVLLYFHGGGYYRGSLHTVREMVGRISRASGLTALSVDYRLAPEHPYPAAVEDAVAAYRWLLEKGVAPRQIVLGGDSAGGGLCAALMIKVRGEGAPLPAAWVCLSPWVDLTQSGESYETRAHEDPSITKPYLDHAAQLYLNGVDAHDPLASPLYADLSGLPPLLIQVGTAEVLLDDSTRLEQNARAAGVQVELQSWEGMTHVWQNNGPQLPEATDAVSKIGEFIKKVLA